MEKFSYRNSNMPTEFKGFSPMMVNALLNAGFDANDTITLLGFANANNNHPDWSEDSTEKIAQHFHTMAAFTL